MIRGEVRIGQYFRAVFPSGYVTPTRRAVCVRGKDMKKYRESFGISPITSWMEHQYWSVGIDGRVHKHAKDLEVFLVSPDGRRI